MRTYPIARSLKCVPADAFDYRPERVEGWISQIDGGG